MASKGKIWEGIQGRFEENTVWANLKSSIKIKRNKNVFFFFKRDSLMGGGTTRVDQNSDNKTILIEKSQEMEIILN